MFFIGYVIVELPANLILKVTTPQFWLPTLTLLWGITSVIMGLCHNQGGIYAARFFLGVVEAGLFPGVVYTFSTYYKRNERTARVSFFFGAAAAAGAFGGVLAYGLSQIDGGGKPRWAWIFIVEGLLTIVIAVLAYWIVPSWPAKARQFTHRERAIIQHRLQLDSDAFESQGFQWSEVYRAFKSPQVYGYCFLFHGFAFALYTLSLFLPTIIQSLGYKSWQAQLLSTPVRAISTTEPFLQCYETHLRLLFPFAAICLCLYRDHVDGMSFQQGQTKGTLHHRCWLHLHHRLYHSFDFANTRRQVRRRLYLCCRGLCRKRASVGLAL